jgi:hypothetical protein
MLVSAFTVRSSVGRLKRFAVSFILNSFHLRTNLLFRCDYKRHMILSSGIRTVQAADCTCMDVTLEKCLDQRTLSGKWDSVFGRVKTPLPYTSVCTTIPLVVLKLEELEYGYR